jgi:flagellar hook-length control protein FliK
VPTPAAQLVARIAPLREGPDGIHRLTIQLNPEELGPISVVAELRNGDIAVRLAGTTEAGREALAAALPDMKRDLQEAGYGSCSLDLRDRPDSDGHQQRWTGRPTPADAPEDRRPAPGHPVVATAPARGDRPGLDLHV